MNALNDQMELAKTLSYNYVFRGVRKEALHGLAATADIRVFDGGDVIVRQFETNDDLIVLLSGGAKIKSFSGETVAEFGPGSILGEMSLIDSQPRSATVVACHKTIAAVLSADVLRGMMNDDPEVRATIMTNMSKVLSRRLRTMNERFDEHSKPLAYAR